jgi:alpha-1,3-mannosyltransferase
LDESIFLDSRLHIGLLVSHLLFLVLFCSKKWLPKKFGTRLSKFPNAVIKTIVNAGKEKSCSLQIISMLFVSNFIGMVFARSLHYQVSIKAVNLFHLVDFLSILIKENVFFILFKKI